MGLGGREGQELVERMRMSLRAWIRQNREMIDTCIKRQVPQAKLNDDERRLWVLNDEGLYQAARQDGWLGEQ